MLQFKLAVYDRIFKRRIVEVKVGLCHKIRLREEGYVLAYKDGDGDEIYIVRCPDCKRYYLDRLHGIHQQRFYCPFCTRTEMVKKVHSLQ